MHSLKVNTSSNQYEVYVGSKLRYHVASYCQKNYSSVFIITDSQVATRYLNDVESSFSPDYKVFTAIVPAGEESKSQQRYFELISDAVRFGLDRHSLIVALGGGVVGDLAGFVAATYMRGVDYIQVPTTILAHDSSVGGKVAINHPEGKNLIGSFYPPEGVFYDVDTLYTLPEKEIRSGYAEVIKHALIWDEEMLTQLLAQNQLFEFSNDLLSEHLFKGISIKARIVEQDERETGMRQYLNFGHTLAHALEAELGYGKITHGEAVAIGMLFAMQVSMEVLSASLPYDQLYRWLAKYGYPLTIPVLEVDAVLNRMKKDKKSKNNSIQMVLLEKVSTPIVVPMDEDKLRKLLKKFLRELVAS